MLSGGSTVARSVKVHVVDDIDGSPADETVKFVLDGIGYEIDLSAAHADEFRAAVARYIVAGRRASSGIVTGARQRGKGTVRSDRADNQVIRDWAKSHGIAISD